MDTACYAPAEVILHVFRGFTNEMDMFEVAGKRCFFGRGMNGLMVIVFQPFPEVSIEDIERQAVGNRREELGSECFKPAFDLAPALRFIGAGMNQRYPQRGCDMGQMMGAEVGAVIHIDFPRKPPFRKRLS